MDKEENNTIKISNETSSNKLSKLYFIIYLLLTIPFVSLFLFIVYDLTFQVFLKALFSGIIEGLFSLTLGINLSYFILLFLLNFINTLNFYQKWIIATIIYYLGIGIVLAVEDFESFIEVLFFTPYYFILALIVYYLEKYIGKKTNMDKEENNTIKVSNETSSNKLSKLYFIIYLLLTIPFISLFSCYFYDATLQELFEGLFILDSEVSILVTLPYIIYSTLLFLLNFVNTLNFYQKWIIATVILYLVLGIVFPMDIFIDLLFFTPYYFILALIVYYLEKYIGKKVFKK